MNSITRCAGEVLGENWGHPDRICERRNRCERFRLLEQDHVTGSTGTKIVGWSCADDAYSDYIKSRNEEQLELFGT